MCYKCNNSASKDEEYLACLIDCIVSGTTDPAEVRRDKVKRLLIEKPRLHRLMERSCRDEGAGKLAWSLKKRRVDRVLLKMARGLVAYDLADPRLEDPDYFAVYMLPNLSETERQEFENVPEQTILPEIGSRAFIRDAAVVHIEVIGREPMALPLPHLPWIEIQSKRYRYATSYASGLTVRIVLSEFLACEVRWN